MAARKPANESDPVDDGSLSRRVLVNVRRDQTSATPRVVWRHEVAVLEAIFGEGNVVIVPPEELDDEYSAKPTPDMLVHNKTQDVIPPPSQAAGLGYVFIGHPRAEYDRLVAAYGKHPEVNESMAEHVFGRYQSGLFARVVGTPKLDDLPAAQLRSLLLEFGYSLPIVDRDSTDAERARAKAEHDKFHGFDHASLVKLAQEYGVRVGA